MNPTIKIELPQWVKNWHRLILNVIAGVLTFTVLVRAFWYGGDTISNLSLLAAAIVWIFTLSLESESSVSEKPGWRIIRVAALLLPLLSLFVVVYPTPGYWVNAANGESTLTRYFLLTPPWFQPIYYVPKAFDQSVPVDIKTRDGVPLQCTVSAKGIVLDQRDVRALEKAHVELAASGSPERYINSALMGTLSKVAEAVLVSKTSEEIYRQGQFLIPYKIGTPMGDTLSRLMLRWSKGEVTFKCKVPFES